MLGPIVVVLALVCAADSFPNGAPAGVCDSMTPKHGADSQSSPSPFSLAVNATSVKSLSSDDDSSSTIRGLTVTIKSSDGTQFKGFFLQALDDNGPIGTFVIPGDGNGKIINCNKLTNNAVTHSSKHKKLSESFTWIPPQDFKGRVTFTATVVENTKTFWTGITSSPVSVV